MTDMLGSLVAVLCLSLLGTAFVYLIHAAWELWQLERRAARDLEMMRFHRTAAKEYDRTLVKQRERSVELGERWLEAEKRLRKEFIELHRALAEISAPSPEQWVTLAPPFRTDLPGTYYAPGDFLPGFVPERALQHTFVPDQPLEHWSDVRRGLSGPFTLERRR